MCDVLAQAARTQAASAGVQDEITGQQQTTRAPVMSLNSEVSDVPDVTDVKSHEYGIDDMARAAPGISL